MNPTNKPLAILLGGKRYTLLFDLNTFEKFEEITGKFFLDFLASMQSALETVQRKADLHPAGVEQAGLDFLRCVSIRDLRAFVYAALHDYDQHGEPRWSLTIGQMGRLITADNIPEILALVMRGHQANAPDAEDLKGEPPDNHPPQAAEQTPAAGGFDFGPTDASILDSLTPTSEG